MIEVKRDSGSISVKGHAHYASLGNDIICAAVSTLTQNLVASIVGLTEDKIQYDLRPGNCEIKYGDISEATQLLIDSFVVGIQLIAGAYPQYVRISIE